jgi:hypothetical protein
MKTQLNKIIIANDQSHHLIGDKPLYAKRFLMVLKFHPPGIAAALDETGAYHIDLHGNAVYAERYSRTFGFYSDRAAVVDGNTWFHISPTGQKVYSEYYAWCGNFQNDVCTVRDMTNYYFHIDLHGKPLYQQKYIYAGDFKDGIAVIQNNEGMYTHIFFDGKHIHNRWFYDLDIFHKGFARARDDKGWCHIDTKGQSFYTERYKMIEPFYNGFARVEDKYGALLIINERGEVARVLKEKVQTPLQQLSADLVGYWKTQTIKAAVELKVFNFLPNDEATLAIKTDLDPSVLKRLLRALYELDLIYKKNDLFLPTEKGALLQNNNEISLAAAAIHWAAEPYLTWTRLTDSLKSNHQIYSQMNGDSVFEWLDRDKNNLQLYQTAILAYAKHDYQDIADKVDLSKNHVVIDAGGGQGVLLNYILQKYNHLKGVLLERASVIQNIDQTKQRFSSVDFDLFKKWPKYADAIFLSRVIHDWDDKHSLTILKRAKEALLSSGAIYLVEMLLDENSGNGGMLDLNMLVLTGGMERTKEQFINLVKQAELKIIDTAFLNSGYAILKLIPMNEDE